jgi:hypothetical protein
MIWLILHVCDLEIMLPSPDFLHRGRRELFQMGQRKIVINSYYKGTNTTWKLHNHTIYTYDSAQWSTMHNRQFMHCFLGIKFLNWTCPIYTQCLICEFLDFCSGTVNIWHVVPHQCTLGNPPEDNTVVSSSRVKISIKNAAAGGCVWLRRVSVNTD